MKLTKSIAAFAVCGIFMAGAFADAKGTEIMNKVADFKEPKFSQSMIQTA